MRAELQITDLAAMEDFARVLAAVLRPGDLIILTGDLGAGKTTLTQFLGRALGVTGRVSSPTFVIAREHRSAGDGPGLIHVDAYRLGDAAEFADLDLESDLAESVTVVEWGHGMAEQLSSDRLEITLLRAFEDAAGEQAGDGDPDVPEDESRRLILDAAGAGWETRLPVLADWKEPT
ncbi:tRNA (adenosine(37)-N6)-threonylcarbamoyltransferase complex ATPase subunit type 1 TsaE [Brevibacterium daeguense]|uniref:tRNA threonylcarbamoyladenosine biosynthesis protein TsaE n=1 Tax=Brevibacterium daeguense TaxID=909936 RepID=A0ABP8EG04_9MICO|nr:tRNA (adenosine(37)-N6)-threonylcarbamoyltransferase complex ATPase subunit type 1 TsaE [Brevibacterium daeguense]